jgi:hypothetical protein
MYILAQCVHTETLDVVLWLGIMAVIILHKNRHATLFILFYFLLRTAPWPLAIEVACTSEV